MNPLFRLAAAFMRGYCTTDPDRLGLPKPLPTQRPKPAEIPSQRPPADRLHRVELLAALRATSKDGETDLREWDDEVSAEHVVGRLMSQMKPRDARGEGW